MSDLDAIRRGARLGSYDDDKVREYLASNAEGGQNGGEGIRLDGPPSADDLKGKLYIFNNRLCPFGNRAWAALEAKGASSAFTYVHIDLGPAKPEWYSSVNPFGTVPCIFDDGKPVFESGVCVEYLEDKFPDAYSLFPGDAADKAKIRAFIAKFGDGFIPAFYQLLMNKDPDQDAEKAENLRTKLAKLEELFAAGSPDGPFFTGSNFTAADINLVPFLYRFVHTLAYYRGFEMFPDGGAATPRLYALLQAVPTVEAFAKTLPDPHFLIAAYYRYAGGAADKK